MSIKNYSKNMLTNLSIYSIIGIIKNNKDIERELI